MSNTYLRFLLHLSNVGMYCYNAFDLKLCTAFSQCVVEAAEAAVGEEDWAIKVCAHLIPILPNLSI